MAFNSYGVVLIPDDFTLADYPSRISAAGIHSLGLHHASTIARVTEFIESSQGIRVLGDCKRQGIEVEYELHAMKDLLPRSLFDRNPEMFRMNSERVRTPDANCCVHSREALETICETAIARCRILKPTTHRYFLWGDDGAEGCRCPRCRELSFSDQALLLENALLKALKTIDPQASLAHLAYEATYPAPMTIKPDTGVFLEFAPIRRRFDQPLRAQAPHWDALQANLEWFGREGSQVLDYWIDVSLFSHWVRPSPELPDRSKVLAEDLVDYAETGIEHVRSFAVMLDQEYVDRHGDAPLQAYGRAQQPPSV